MAPTTTPATTDISPRPTSSAPKRPPPALPSSVARVGSAGSYKTVTSSPACAGAGDRPYMASVSTRRPSAVVKRRTGNHTPPTESVPVGR